ncbi:hypothetical protein BGZ80_003969 [Entomortierella chlamydospora]|uniref:Uncharacterized protein n=1 Tax=Entomortierella chlamydospora TaxID=101097 RepID=A0A9P6MNX0_9FUNG|nr:hypothetical protein BGZ80_003969 [Entomortierella chlamydospora]
MGAHRAVRVKKGYTIDVRTSALEKVCYFETHQSMYIVENNCKDKIVAYLSYYKSTTDYWNPRMTTHITSYYGPSYIIMPGETQQIYGPSGCLCSIRIKSVVDTKFKTIRATKPSQMHDSFHYKSDGILTYYGVATDASERYKPHSSCAKNVNFLPVNHSSLSELPGRLLASRNNRA